MSRLFFSKNLEVTNRIIIRKTNITCEKIGTNETSGGIKE